MPKIVAATEAKNRFGALSQWVKKNGDAVVVENRGSDFVVIITPEEYEQFQQLKEQQRRQDGLNRLRALRSEGADLTEAEAIELGVRAIDEVRNDAASVVR